MLESEKVEIGLILLKLLSDKVQIISKLVVFFSDREKVISADRLHDTICFCNELLELLGIITDKSISVEARTLKI